MMTGQISSAAAEKPYTLERQQTAMFLVRDQAGNRLGMISGRAGSWKAEKMTGSALSCCNTRHDAAMALINCR